MQSKFKMNWINTFKLRNTFLSFVWKSCLPFIVYEPDATKVFLALLRSPSLLLDTDSPAHFSFLFVCSSDLTTSNFGSSIPCWSLGSADFSCFYHSVVHIFLCTSNIGNVKNFNVILTRKILDVTNCDLSMFNCLVQRQANI